MFDLFGALQGFQTVARVSNLASPFKQPLNAVFYICPKMSGRGLRINRAGTGFDARYVDDLSQSAAERLQRVARFAAEAGQAGLQLRLTAIFAAADAHMLFPLAVPPPAPPRLDLPVRSNLNAFLANTRRFAQLYQSAPWRSIPARFRQTEVERLTSLLPSGSQCQVKDDFAAKVRPPVTVAEDLITRIFAGFALDGLTLREGLYGPAPIILGVESPGVAMLQNAALPRELWLPVIQLR